MVFLGFHADKPTIDYQPSLCSETRRTVAALAFIVDKDIAIFTGRPPQISRRFMTTPPPLDFKEGDLHPHQNADERAAAVKLLDSYGWNTDGKPHGYSCVRTRFMIALLRDEIIEIALPESQFTPQDIILFVNSFLCNLFFPGKLLTYVIV